MVTTVSTKPAPNTSWWIYLLEGIGAILVGILLLTAPGRTVSPSPFSWVVLAFRRCPRAGAHVC